MITPIKAMTINQIVERKDDLLVSVDDIKEIARNEHNKAIDDFIKLINEISGWTPNCIEHNLSLTVFTLHQIAEELKC